MSRTWHPDRVAESLLRGGGNHTRTEVEAAFRYLVGSFENYIGAESEVVWEPRYEDVYPGRWGWACALRSIAPIGGPLRVEWYAVLCNNSHCDPYAFVLLFAGGDRLIRLPRREYLSFTYPLIPTRGDP